MSNKINLLFICSRNQWRNPTSEKIWKNNPNYNTKSASTSPNAKRTVSSTDIRWADIIFVMESKHNNRLKVKFTRLLDYKIIHVLDIPDEYKYMDAELISELKLSVSPLLS